MADYSVQEPTLASIGSVDQQLLVDCATCRRLCVLDHLKLAKRRGPHRPISAFRFRCKRCGAIGKPLVEGRGQVTTGYKRIWPATGEDQKATRALTNLERISPSRSRD